MIAEKILECANTYLMNADRLIYSHGSMTFLSGYDLYDRDHGNRGNIDCSAFVILVLSGIPYEKSPYATGTVKGMRPGSTEWAEQGLVDFSDLPDRYIGIAERIGRPYFEGPKGLDLHKAETLGISVQMLEEEILASGVIRRSVFLADRYRKKGTCFSDPDERRPGDLVFFYSNVFFKEGGKVFSVKPEIKHVGIIDGNTDMMINSSSKGPAVSRVPVIGEREIAFFVHTV